MKNIFTIIFILSMGSALPAMAQNNDTQYTGYDPFLYDTDLYDDEWEEWEEWDEDESSVYIVDDHNDVIELDGNARILTDDDSGIVTTDDDLIRSDSIRNDLDDE